MTKQHHAVTKYVIARIPAEYPAQAETFTVVYEVRENVSHHETLAEARKALAEYEERDRLRVAPAQR